MLASLRVSPKARSSLPVALVLSACGARTDVDPTRAEAGESEQHAVASNATAAGSSSGAGGRVSDGGTSVASSTTTGGAPGPSYANCDEQGPCLRQEQCLVDNEQATGQYCTIPCANAALCAPAPDGVAEIACRVLPSSPVAVCALDCTGTPAGLRGPCPLGMTCHEFPVGGTQHTCMWRD
jgi:hypothetical protein